MTLLPTGSWSTSTKFRDQLRVLAENVSRDELYENLHHSQWALTEKAEMMLHDDQRLLRLMEALELGSDEVEEERRGFNERLANIEWSLGMEMQAMITWRDVEVDTDIHSRLRAKFDYEGFDAMAALMDELKLKQEEQREYCLDIASDLVAGENMPSFDFIRWAKKRFPDLQLEFPDDTEFYYSRDSQIYREMLEEMCHQFPRNIYWRLSLAEYHATYGDPAQGVEIAQDWLIGVDGEERFHMDRFYDNYYYRALCGKGFQREIWSMVEDFDAEGFDIEEIRSSYIEEIANNESVPAAIKEILACDDEQWRDLAFRNLATELD